MMDRFKAFLAGAPYRMSEDKREGWAHQIAVILPSVLQEWHDPEFGDDVWAKDGVYYEAARKKLVALSGFRSKCNEASETLQALKMLADFFAEEKRKKGLGKTIRKAIGGGHGVTALPGAGEGNGGHGVTALPCPPQPEVLEEGDIIEMHGTKRERNPELRAACIAHYRAQHGGRIACAACGMAFGERYGELGDGYIEVHHLNPISQTEGTHTVNPVTDLVPLCANCHAMIHRLMAAEKKGTGLELEGTAALEKLKGVIV